MARLSSVEADFNTFITLGMLKAVPQLEQVVQVPVPEVDGFKQRFGSWGSASTRCSAEQPFPHQTKAQPAWMIYWASLNFKSVFLSKRWLRFASISV